MSIGLPIAAIVVSIIAVCVACYTLHCQMRITRYTYLANRWYEIKDKELANPDFTDPNKTASYNTYFQGDLLRAYETFAWMCWGHAEDVYLNKWHKDPGFEPSLKWYKKLHYNWFKEPRNSEHFKDAFIKYIDELE